MTIDSKTLLSMSTFLTSMSWQSWKHPIHYLLPQWSKVAILHWGHSNTGDNG